MKTKNIIIGVLTVAVITLSIFLFRTYSLTQKSMPLPNNCNDKSMQLDGENLKLICTAGVPKNDGDPMKYGDFAAGIREFEAGHQNDSIKGFHMGLTTLETMFHEIEQYNARPGLQDSIVGVTFHRVITSRDFGNYHVQNKYDLAAAPTFKSEAISTMGSKALLSGSGVEVYSYFRPCPKLCNN